MFDWTKFLENIFSRKISSLKMKKMTYLLEIERTTLIDNILCLLYPPTIQYHPNYTPSHPATPGSTPYSL